MSGEGGPRCPICEAGLRWAGAICPACEQPGTRPDLAWLRVERLGGLAQVDGRPGMFVRIGGPETKWADRVSAGEDRRDR